MKTQTQWQELKLTLPLAFMLAFAPGLASAFTSGSTGVDGAFNPTVSQVITIPESGVFNYTTVNIPTGVTITYKRNTTNTPITMLATGNVTIAGTINVSGSNGADTGPAGDGAIGNDGQPGIGGPGGFDGGVGGTAGPIGAAVVAGAGMGPGSGAPGARGTSGCPYTNGGGGGGFGGAGGNSDLGTYTGYVSCGIPPATGGVAYGSSQLLPLIGGSGGGGGGGGITYVGSGGGGGGGAILIASSGTLTISGAIYANGGYAGGAGGDTGSGATGGGGAGGGIRLMASTLAGNGTIQAIGQRFLSGCSSCQWNGGTGAPGRIRLEADSITRTAASNPVNTFGTPGSVFVSGLPTLLITNVAGVAVPANPTGTADVTLPSTTPNPVTVAFSTTGVPPGNTVKVTVTPATGVTSTATSTALTGDTNGATANASITLPSGPSTLSATVTYSIVVALGEELSKYAQGERVEKVRLSAVLNGPSTVTLITRSGKEFLLPPNIPFAGVRG